MRTYADIAALIVSFIPRPNPVLGAQVVDDLGLVNDTPTVTLTVGNARRRAVYLPPHAIQEGGNVFVMRIGPELTGDLVVLATNYQVG